MDYLATFAEKIPDSTQLGKPLLIPEAVKIPAAVKRSPVSVRPGEVATHLRLHTLGKFHLLVTVGSC
jgi:hypothetical protein